MFLVISFAPHGLWLSEMGLPFWLYIARNNYGPFDENEIIVVVIHFVWFWHVFTAVD